MPHKAKPLVRALQNNGIVPNNRRWPLVIYRRALASFTTIMEAR